MAFNSKSLYTGDGSQLSFTITFPFISVTHVFIFLNGVMQLNPLNYSISGSVVSFVSPPESGDAVEIKRSTSPINLLVDFQDGSVLNESDLDLAYQHNFYLLQETTDGFNQLINESLIDVATDLGIVTTDTDEILAAMVNEMLSLESASTIQQRVSDIDANAEAILTLGEGLQVQINTLAQGVAANVYLDDDEPVPGESPYPDPIAEGSRWYDTNDNNAPYIYQSSAWVSIEDPRVGQAAADISIIEVNVEQNYAAILQELFVRTTETTALSQSLNLLGAASGDKTSFILDLDSVLIDDDLGVTLATRFSQLDATDGSNSAAISTEQTARVDQDNAIATTFALLGAENGGGTAFILNEDTVKINLDSGDTLAERFTGLSASISDNADGVSQNASDITSVETAYVSADAVVAGTVTALAVRVTNNEGDMSTAQLDIIANVGTIGAAQGTADQAISDAASVAGDLVNTDLGVGDLQARYGVVLNVNDYITGFLQNNDGSTGSFVILADKFGIVTPSRVWAAITAITLGDNYRPSTDNGRVFECTTAGTTGASEPTWNTTIGNETNDGTVVWTCRDDTGLFPFTISGNSIQMNADVQINGSLMINGTLIGAALVAGTIGSTQIGNDAITTTHLGADSVTANKIEANAVTAGKINVTNLAAINADIGSIVAGDITLDTDGYIRGGQTAFNTGSGFYLGYDSGDYVFSIGDSGSNFLTWDGATLRVKGEVIIGGWLASETLITDLPTEGEAVAVYGAESVKYKKVTMDRAGSVRLKYSARWTSPAGDIDFSDNEDPDYWLTIPYVKVYLNGTLILSHNWGGGYNPTTMELGSSYDLSVSADDYIEISVSGGRFFDTSAAVNRDVTMFGGMLSVSADNTITGNTVNTDD